VRSLDLDFNGPQSRAYELLAPGRTICLPWGRGVGKSFFLRTVQWLLLSKYKGATRPNAPGNLRGVRIVWLLPTFKQFKAVHGQALRMQNDEEWAFLGGKLDKTTFRFEFPDGSWVQPFPASEHHSNAARALRCDVVLPDEVDDIDPGVFHSIVRPWFSEPWSLKIRVAGGTPRRGRNGLLYQLHKSGLDPGQPRYHTIHATHRDAPETVDPTEVADAKANSPAATFAREWECDFDSAEGLVYVFDESFHVRMPPEGILFTRFAVGVDHGWTDPGVHLLCGIQGHGEDAVLWVLDEVYETERPNEWWNQKAQEWVQYRATWHCDPSRPERIRDLNRFVTARKGVNAIEAGVARVADLLAIHERENGEQFARLYVSPRCTNLIREMGQYRRKKDPHNADRFLEAIAPGSDHCFADGTMVLTSQGERPIETVAVGDLVLTRAGWRPVLGAGLTRESAKVQRLTLSNGRVLIGTPDHLVWTVNRGWIRLSELRESDTLLACADQDHTRTQRSLSSTASASSATQTHHDSSCADTMSPGKGGACIGRSGSSTTEQSQRGSTSTTRTGTPSTTHLRTWSASPRVSITRNTSDASPRSTEQSAPHGWSASDPLPRHGTPARKGSNGTGSTLAFCGKVSSQPREPVNCAAGPTRTAARPDSAGSAPTTASQPGGAGLVSTTSSAAARNAQRCSQSTGTRKSSPVRLYVLANESLDQSVPVYDLTVDGCHEFYAEGVLVHNCQDALRYACMGEFGPASGSRHDAAGN
jgi:hypothetical protein